MTVEYARSIQHDNQCQYQNGDDCFTRLGKSHREKKCAECGSEENIEVHHVDGNRTNNSIENLAPLCHSCHVKIHTDDPDMNHWIEKLDPTPYFGELTEDEVNQAFDQVDFDYI